MNQRPRRLQLDPQRLYVTEARSKLGAPHALFIVFRENGAIEFHPFHGPGVDREGLARGLAQLNAYLVENPGLGPCIAGTCAHRPHRRPEPPA